MDLYLKRKMKTVKQVNYNFVVKFKKNKIKKKREKMKVRDLERDFTETNLYEN